MKPFEVSEDEVGRLGPIELVLLIKRLVEADLQQWGVPLSAVHGTLRINVPDGGEDLRVEWSQPSSKPGVMHETTGSDDPQRPQLQLTFNHAEISAPTRHAVVLSSELVDFLYEAMAKADLSKRPSNDQTQYKFRISDITAAERRAMFENWIFSKAFQDLMRGVRSSLEQALFFLELAARPQKSKV